MNTPAVYNSVFFIFETLHVGLVTLNWSFQYRLVLVAGLVRTDPIAHSHLLFSSTVSDHVSRWAAAKSSELGASLFRILARNSWTARDFTRFYALISDDWSDDTQRSVLGDVLGSNLEARLIMPGCSCGCVEPSVNPEVLGKLTALVTMGLMGASESRKVAAAAAAAAEATAAAAAAAATAEATAEATAAEEEEWENAECMSCDDAGEMSIGDRVSSGGEAGSAMLTPGPAVSRYFQTEE